MCFQIHVGYLPKNKDSLCTLSILIFILQALLVAVYSGRKEEEMILATPACIVLRPFLCSPMRELGGAELTSVSFSNAGILGGRSYLFQPAFCADTQLSCKIYIENGFNKPY